jgi:hypothetical protein
VTLLKENKLPQPKQYKNAAQRQAAYRARQPKRATQARLAQLANTINYLILDNANTRYSRLPDEVVGTDIEQTLRNLICWLDPYRDPVQYPNWELFHPAGTLERDPFEDD